MEGMYVVVLLIFLFVLYVWYKRKANQIICPNVNCNYRGTGKASGGKSLIVLILLLCLGIIPGLIYLFWPIDKHLGCPRCKTRVR